MASLTKQVHGRLEQAGFIYDRTNSKQIDYYRNDEGREIALNPSASEVGLRLVLRELDKLSGTCGNAGKRNPAKVKDRQARERKSLDAEIHRDKEAHRYFNKAEAARRLVLHAPSRFTA